MIKDTSQVSNRSGHSLPAAAVVLLLTSLLVAVPASAERRFVIEMLIFERTGVSAAAGEPNPAPTKTLPGNKNYWPNGDSGSNSIIQNLPFNGPMKAVADRLRSKGGHRIIFRKRWEQKLQPYKNAPSLVVKAGKRQDDEFELEGSVRIGVDRYLHLGTNLWLNDFSDDGYGVQHVFTLKQRRRMRSAEFHYIDHPKLGMIVRIEPETK